MIPAGFEVTVPDPLPDFVTERVTGGGGLKVAVTPELPERLLMVQGPVPVQPAAFPVPPLHPANPDPVPVKVTEVPLANTAGQVVAPVQLIPAGLDVTDPLPAPAPVTVTETVENCACKWVVACASETSVAPVGRVF